MFKHIVFGAAATIWAAGMVSAADISDGKITATEILQGTKLSFKTEGWPKDAKGVMILINGPGRYQAEVEFGSAVPVVNLAKHGDVEDGYYSYEIRVGTSQQIKKPEFLDNGRGKDDIAYDYVSYVLSGVVLVANGTIVNVKNIKEESDYKPEPGKDPGPDTDSGEKPEIGDGKEGEGDSKGLDLDKG